MSYSFLIEMAWKSALISGVALVCVALLRSRSAADRGAVLRVGVLLLLSLPVIALLFPSLVVETPAEQAVIPAAATAAAAAPALTEAQLAPYSAAPEAASGNWNDPSILFLLLYAGGVLMVAGRLLAGLWTLRRWTAAAEPVTAPEWLAALTRAGGQDRGIRLLASADAGSPLSWGFRRPVILLDADSLRRPEHADAIVAHEVAHIARADWLSLLLSRLTVALFWFNPLVWKLDREVAHQAEEAADSCAARAVEPASYAQTLLDWARHDGGLLPANAMAGSEPGLSRRVRALLDGRFRRRSGSFWTFAAIAACAAVAAPVAALEFVQQPPEAPEPPIAPDAPHAPAAPASVAAVPQVPPAPPAAHPALAPLVPPPAEAGVAPPAPPARLAMAQPAHPPHPPRGPHPIVDGEAIGAEVGAAVAEAMRAAAAASAHAVDAEAIAEQVRRSVAVSMRAGAEGMRRGADGMERGARNMRAEAQRLRSSREYREEQIRKAAQRGERVTHEELLEAADDMEEGARDMMEGARDMREAADEMRRGG